MKQQIQISILPLALALLDTLKSNELPTVSHQTAVWARFIKEDGDTKVLSYPLNDQLTENQNPIIQKYSDFKSWTKLDPLRQLPTPIDIRTTKPKQFQELFDHLDATIEKIVFIPVMLWSHPIGYLLVPADEETVSGDLIFKYLHPLAECAGYSLITHLLSYFDESVINSCSSKAELADEYIQQISKWCCLEIKKNPKKQYSAEENPYPWDIELEEDSFKLECPQFCLTIPQILDHTIPLLSHNSFIRKRESIDKQIQLVYKNIILIWNLLRGDRLNNKIEEVKSQLTHSWSKLEAYNNNYEQTITKLLSQLNSIKPDIKNIERREYAFLIKNKKMLEIWFNGNKVEILSSKPLLKFREIFMDAYQLESKEEIGINVYSLRKHFPKKKFNVDMDMDIDPAPYYSDKELQEL